MKFVISFLSVIAYYFLINAVVDSTSSWSAGWIAIWFVFVPLVGIPMAIFMMPFGESSSPVAAGGGSGPAIQIRSTPIPPQSRLSIALSSIVGWLVGVVLLLLGIGAAVSAPVSFLPFAFAAAIVIPSSRRWIGERTGFPRKSSHLVASVLFLVVSGLVVAGAVEQSRQREEAIAADQAKAEEERKAVLERERALREEFANDRAAILAEVQRLTKNGELTQAVALARKYEVVDDAELKQLGTEARGLLRQKRNAEREAELVALAKTVPADQIQKNIDIYRELAQLQPNNSLYQTKLSHYRDRMKVQKEKDAEERRQAAAREARKKEIEKQFSAWDGSHRGLERYIKAQMNDPDSYDHIETRYVDQGNSLLLMTKFRGKNAFGGVIINQVTAVVDMNGNVKEVLYWGT